MIYTVILLSLYRALVAYATPPACFLSCINELSRQCSSQSDLTCLCDKADLLIGCLVDICPYGTFESSRDHYFGTCLEHKYQINPPPGQRPPFWNPPATPTHTLALATKIKPSTAESSIVQTVPSEVNPEHSEINSMLSSSMETQTFTTLPTTVTTSLEPPPKWPKPHASTSTSTLARPTPDDNYDSDNDDYGDDNDHEDDGNTNDEDDTECDDNDLEATEITEWEEIQSTDKDGNIIIVRKPISMPEKYKPTPNQEWGQPTRVIYILKHVKERISMYNESNTPDTPGNLTLSSNTMVQSSLSHMVAPDKTSMITTTSGYHTKRMQVLRRMKHATSPPVQGDRNHVAPEVIYDGYIE